MQTSAERSFENLEYHAGLGDTFISEALPKTVPLNQNSPQVCPRGLYAEQLSGTSFTQPRHLNLKSWLYRILPSVTHGVPKPVAQGTFPNFVAACEKSDGCVNPAPLRWRAIPDPAAQTSFLEGVFTFAFAGSPELKDGLAIHGYSFNKDMNDSAFFNADGDFLFVPQTGQLHVTTEFGLLEVGPKEILVIPRGIKFSMNPKGICKGWVLELFKGHFRLPELGPIGANCLAAPRHFLAPKAFFEHKKAAFKMFSKFNGAFFEADIDHSPFDVVGWHGNYYPFKYNLELFNTLGTISFDHPDPSIFTVLTAASDEPGTAACDFVIFPERWMVAENTFRPPYYHRNTMSEFMGNIHGKYDAKGEGFGPGCSSLHSCMTGHGPDQEAFDKASSDELKPFKISNTLSFMFETCYLLKIAKPALDEVVKIDHKYADCWQRIEDKFDSRC